MGNLFHGSRTAIASNVLSLRRTNLHPVYLFTSDRFRRERVAIRRVLSAETGSMRVSALSFKASFLLSYRDKVMELHETLRDLFEEELARGEEIRKALLSRLNEFLIPACAYTVAVSSTIILFLRPVIVRITKQLIRLQVPMHYGLPYEGKYPWTIPDNFLYHVHFLLELLNLWFFLFTTCGFDESFGYYSFQISSILRAVAFRLESPLPGDEVRSLLRSSVQKHQRLLRCRECMERIYGPNVFWMILTSTLLMCSLIYETVLVRGYAPRNTRVFSHVCKTRSFDRPCDPLRLFVSLAIARCTRRRKTNERHS